MLSKTIKLEPNENKCQEIVVMVFRNDDGEDGVLISGWYEIDGQDLIASRFIEMELEDAQSFVRDYSSISAEDFIYNQIH